MSQDLDNFKKLCNNLKIKFSDYTNLILAFTHSSCGERNYERLEFLGDSVLRLVISDYLFKKFENDNEGKLTKIRAELVSDKALTIFAKKINFQDYVLLGKGEKRTGKSMDTILACVFEAFLGAIYLEYGTNKAFKTVSDFILKNFENEIIEIENEIDVLNPKALLQEYSQSELHELPVYNLVKEEGLAHKKIFMVNVTLGGKTFKPAKGSTKKEAQKLAAKNALIDLKIIKEN